ncbi:MAG: DUF2974 domain-containing protein [Clostridiales bacterium]|nr:DUF2974 domain-containing protein [Clostridiales bacterium]
MLFQYLRQMGHLRFLESPPTEADLLIFATMAYCPMERLGGNGYGWPLSLTGNVLYPKAARYDETDMARKRRQLWMAASQTTRFGEVKFGGFRAHFSPEKQQQFAACAFRIAPQTGVIAFRGTDSTLVGWKEDLNLSFESPVPAQQDAAKFLNDMLALYSHAYVVGHSKGGNLALFAAARCNPALQSRILHVINFDGPGLDQQTRQSPGYRALEGRVTTYVPQDSVVGMLMNGGEPYTIIASEGSGLQQHNTFLWQLSGGALVKEESLTQQNRYASDTLRTFLASLSIRQRRSVVDALYSILSATGAKKIGQIPLGALMNLDQVLKATAGLSPQQHRALLGAVIKLLGAGASHLDVLLGGGNQG